MLEEILLKFAGTVLLVSHDRDFMDNVITSLVVLDGHGGVSEHVGGYSDWEARGGSLSEARAHPSAKTKGSSKQVTAANTPATPTKKRKLSYKEQRELDKLPGIIETLEQQQSKWDTPST